MISTRFGGQLTVEQLVDRYDLACRPVRDLLVDYLRERQPTIGSLLLPPDIAAGRKQRIQTRTVRAPGGGEQVLARQSADDALMAVRAFYLDLAQWAPDDPARLDAARAAPPGEMFTAGGQTLRRADTVSHRTWAEDPGGGKRRDLGREEDNAFWAWAAIKVLTHTGIRPEELIELSHHSLVQYRLPTSGELILRARTSDQGGPARN